MTRDELAGYGTAIPKLRNCFCTSSFQGYTSRRSGSMTLQFRDGGKPGTLYKPSADFASGIKCGPAKGVAYRPAAMAFGRLTTAIVSPTVGPVPETTLETITFSAGRF